MIIYGVVELANGITLFKKFKVTYELLNLGARKFSFSNKLHIFG